MSFLDDLIAGAQGFLTEHTTKQGGETDAIAHDRYDEQLFQELRTNVPAFSDLIRDFQAEHPVAEDMSRDILLEFWKGLPQLRKVDEMARTHIINQGVADTIMHAPETPDTRRLTIVDKYGSVMATIAVADKIREYLNNHKEVEEKQDEANAADQALDSACSGLAAAIAEAVAAAQALTEALGGLPTLGNGMPMGPLTEAQLEALEAAQWVGERLQKALDEGLVNVTYVQGASEEFDLTAIVAVAAMNGDIRDAMKEVAKQLTDQINLFHAWGFEDGDIEKLSFKERAALAAKLMGTKFHQFASYLGRTRLVGSAMQARKVEYGREEVVGTELSGDVSRVMASEWARGRHPLLRLQFLADLAARKLLSKKMVGTENVGKGAIICCIDCSSSMKSKYGSTQITRELPAKATMLALLDEARRQKRDFVCINFSSASQQRTWVWNKGIAQIDEVIAAVEHFFNGGTNFMRPLDIAADLLEREYNGTKRMAGDIVFITDDDCRVAPEWLRGFMERKTRLGFRIFGIAIGRNPGGALKSFSDSVRGVWDLTTSDEMTEVLKFI